MISPGSCDHSGSGAWSFPMMSCSPAVKVEALGARQQGSCSSPRAGNCFHIIEWPILSSSGLPGPPFPCNTWSNGRIQPGLSPAMPGFGASAEQGYMLACLWACHPLHGYHAIVGMLPVYLGSSQKGAGKLWCAQPHDPVPAYSLLSASEHMVL